MTILSRQFLASYLSFYVGILFASTLVVIVIEMMLNFDDALEFQQGARGVAIYLFLRLPSYYLPYLIPITSFAAAFLCLGLPARALEIVALKAGGISPRRVCLPVLVAAALISAGSLVLNETIVRDTANEFNRRENKIGMGNLYQSRDGFWYHRGKVFYNVEEADPASRTLRGIRVYERNDEGRLIRSIEAESAQVADDHRWLLHDVTIRSFGPDPAAAPEIRHEAEWVLDMASEQELALLSADAATLSLVRLRDYIDAAARAGRNPNRYRALFHARLADPISVLVFALLAIPVGLAVERSRSLATAAIQGIAVVAVFYTLMTSGALIASGGVASATFAPWVVLGVFGAYGVWRFARIPA